VFPSVFYVPPRDKDPATYDMVLVIFADELQHKQGLGSPSECLAFVLRTAKCWSSRESPMAEQISFSQVRAKKPQFFADANRWQEIEQVRYYARIRSLRSQNAVRRNLCLASW
jgi:hypothetical protein